VLESGQLELGLVDGAFLLRCADARLPICPDSYSKILTYRLEGLVVRLGEDDVHLRELRSILTALIHLPDRTDIDPGRIEERLREKEVVKRRLAALLKESQDIHDFVEDNVRSFNGTPGDAASFDLLDGLLAEQTYRLADWRVAGDEVNYRRFFDINHLAAIRMERPEVFAASHELTLRLVGEGKVAGLRVDHPDGLYAPAEYFRRLQESAILATARRLLPTLDQASAEALLADHRAAVKTEPGSAAARPLWIAAEKILMPEEPLPEWWVVAGTTGYD
jgi:(1->4)-alpha-D-glucan 1-alpha-D-glucosylmutase